MRCIGPKKRVYASKVCLLFLRVTSSVNTLIECNHSREEKAHEFISIKEFLLYNLENIFNMEINCK